MSINNLKDFEIEYNVFDKKMWNQGSAGSWCFGSKDGIEYFIKRLEVPRLPRDNAAQELKEEREIECSNFWDYKNKVFDSLKGSTGGNGNLLVPIDWGYGTSKFFYIISVKADNVENNDFSILSNLSDKDFLITLRVVCYNIKRIHDAGIVHGDLKPYVSEYDTGNIILSKAMNEEGLPRLRIIDFDDSFVSGNPLPYDQTGGTSEYKSPELMKYTSGNYDARCLNTKSDIFTLGLIFYQYSTNNAYPITKVPLPNGYYNALHYINDGNKFDLEISERPYMSSIINKMLSINPNDRPDLSEIMDEIDEKLREMNGEDIVNVPNHIDLTEDMSNDIRDKNKEIIENAKMTLDETIDDFDELDESIDKSIDDIDETEEKLDILGLVIENEKIEIEKNY